MPDMDRKRLMFLPGATGDPSFWYEVGNRLPVEWDKHYLRWPGLGNQPPDPKIECFDDLVSLAAIQLTSPSVVIAQSMGGIVALLLALQYPDLVTHLILAATSGGIETTGLGAVDWRQDFLHSFPQTVHWILDEQIDLTSNLHEIKMPTLLLWGDADPISPVAVGKNLATAIHGSQLKIIQGADHGMGMKKPDVVAEHILSFISYI